LVGYTGGVQDEVTYENIADYTEALLVEYDPSVTSYEDVLKEWKTHADPYPSKRQYRTALWYLSDDQKERAQKFVDETWSSGAAKYVDVEPATQFFMAEEYHQNFLNKQRAMFNV